MPRLQMHRTSRLLIASTGVDSEWAHAKAATEANPAVAHLNADLWYRWCLLPEGHEFLYQTPALCSNASYSQANVPVTIVLSSKVRNCTLFVEEDGDTLFGCVFRNSPSLWPSAVSLYQTNVPARTTYPELRPLRGKLHIIVSYHAYYTIQNKCEEPHCEFRMCHTSCR